MKDMKKYLSKLVGGKIVHVVKDDSKEALEIFGEALFAFYVIMPEGKRYQVAILSDTEGNGAGFLDIMEVRD